MDGLVILLTLIAALVTLDVAAVRTGVDARDMVDDDLSTRLPA